MIEVSNMLNIKNCWLHISNVFFIFSVFPIISTIGRKINGKYWKNSTRAFEAITDFVSTEELGLGLFSHSDKKDMFLLILWQIYISFLIFILVPIIDVHLQSKTLLPIGETTVFHCRYKQTGRTSPKVRWYHNEIELENDEKYMLHPGGDMILRFVYY